MALSKFGFIVFGPGLSAEQHRSVMRSDSFEMIVLGISDPARGPAAAELLLREGVQLIELCGGFGPAAVAAIQASVAGRVPVGAVSYAAEEVTGLYALFQAPATQRMQHEPGHGATRQVEARVSARERSSDAQ